MRITGNNFQAWETFDLTVEGLTVVIGPSDHGKSAIARATKGTLRNELSADQIRVGADTSEIAIEYGGIRIVAERKKKTVVYTVTLPGGEVKKYTSLKGSIPDEVRDLKFGEIVIGDIKLDPIFATQFGTQFLLEATPQVINAVLGAFSSTEKLESGKREANTQIRDGDASARALAKEVQAAEARAAKLEALAEKADVVEKAIVAGRAAVDGAAARLNVVVALRRHRQAAETLRTTLAHVELPSVDSASRMTTVIETTAWARRAMERHTQLHQWAERLNVEVPEEVHQLAARLEQLQVLSAACKRLPTVQAARSSIETIVADWTRFVTLFQRMRGAHDAKLTIVATERHRRLLGDLDQILTATDTEQVSLLAQRLRLITVAQESIRKHDAAAVGVVDAVQRVAELETQLAEVQEARRIAEIGMITCPECGAQFSQEQEFEHKEGKHGTAA